MKKFSALFSLSLCVLLAGCCKKDTPQPLDQLPPLPRKAKTPSAVCSTDKPGHPKAIMALPIIVYLMILLLMEVVLI